ncbi:MAG: GTP-binding protein LepA [Candidatus Berkelbacteria bacterium Licking1014_7]|uniref:Elongation factor 4 n=1 Tax=Candidatus Berkelbacteria bacterium Licking1014_7 TaxID=2017147 RepID=A0A554LJB9_9BACT|nr:MAG: GTP-binding protein LepA [Candidatus Berkelbacteria bacterium Licking1014_7]
MANENKQDLIRNFCIIAHIDAGKSTLADRLLEITGAIEKGKHTAQFLDQMDLEQERGITIKLQPVRLMFNKSQDTNLPAPKQAGKSQNDLKIENCLPAMLRIAMQAGKLKIPNSGYILNLVDTPGHVDFAYEVSRTLAVVEGAVLLIDATRGTQAQTLSVLEKALAQNLAIIPAINKIDLASAQIEKCEQEIRQILPDKFSKKIYHISAKTGQGVLELIQAIIVQIPSPQVKPSTRGAAGLRALVFDSYYDKHRGVVVYVRIFEGEVKTGDQIKFLASNQIDKALEVGFFSPDFSCQEKLQAGEIGYLVTNLKRVEWARVGDTIVLACSENSAPLDGYKKPQPMVFASIFPFSSADYPLLKKSIEKLSLNDSSFEINPDHSPVLGAGFEIGVLGLLHLEIVLERLHREFDLNIVMTTPSPRLRIKLKNGLEKEVKGVWQLPDQSEISEIFEPYLRIKIISPPDYLGKIFKLCQTRRAKLEENKYLDSGRVELSYLTPITEILAGFYDQLKSISSGFASLSYEPAGFYQSNLAKLEVMLNGETIAPFAFLAPDEKKMSAAKNLALKLKEIIPREVFEIRIQVAEGGKILASERISALKKDVTGHLYGGDITRKKKLWEKQKKGKKRLRQFGKIQLSSDVFLKLLR